MSTPVIESAHGGLRRRVALRLAMMLITLFGVTLLTFAMTRALPAPERDLAGDLAGVAAPPLVDANASLFAQYAAWVGRTIRFDFGASWASKRRVSDVLGDAVPRSLQIMIPGIALCYLIGVPLGVVLAWRRRRRGARVTVAALFALYSVPGFFMATLMIVFLTNPDHVDWFPASGLSSDDAPVFGGWGWMLGTKAGLGFLGDRLWHLVLPVTCVVYGGVAYLAEQTRTKMEACLAEDWVHTARAIGVSERRIVFRHALRNAAIPLVVLLGIALPMAFSGSVFLERVFSIEGVGWTLVQAVTQRDVPVVMAIATLVTALTLIGFFLADLLRVAVDPRVELS